MKDCFKFSAENYRFSGGPVQIAAATGGAGPLPLLSSSLSEPLSVTSVTIHTDGMRAPSVLLNFTSIITVPIGVLISLSFALKRSFNGGPAVDVGPTYTFSKLVEALQSESFGFQFFDENLSPGTYHYSVQISTNSLLEVTPCATISNATLSALAVDHRLF